MDDKTAELRDLFVETTGEESVTEDQTESVGDLSDSAEEADAAERLPRIVGRMRDRYEFESGLADDALESVVRGYFAGDDDDAIADALDVAPETVFAARMDLHLVRDGERDPPFDYETLRRLVVEDVPPAEAAERLDADEAVVERYARVVAADLRSTRANERFVDEFAELLTDQEIERRHAAGAHEDGLDEAAEDIETDVSL